MSATSSKAPAVSGGSHSRPWLQALMEFAQSGGGAAVVTGTAQTSSAEGMAMGRSKLEPAEYYRGLHAPPAATLIEAVLTPLADPRRFDEIVLLLGEADNFPFANAKSCFPSWPLKFHGKTYHVGDIPFAIALTPRDALQTAAAPAAPAAPAGLEASSETSLPATRQIQSLANALKVFKPVAPNVTAPAGVLQAGAHLDRLPKRLRYFFNLLDQPSTTDNRLIIIHESWLHYAAQGQVLGFNSQDPSHWDKAWSEDIPTSTEEAKNVARRFRELPTWCRNHKVCLVFIFETISASDAFAAGKFHHLQYSPDAKEIIPMEPPRLMYPGLQWKRGEFRQIYFNTVIRSNQKDDTGSDSWGWHSRSTGEPHTGSAYQNYATASLSLRSDPLQRLNMLCGLESVKNHFRRTLSNVEAIRQAQQDKGADMEDQKTLHSLLHRIGHFYFVGNPGTGKTTVAALLGDALYRAGFLRLPGCEVITAGALVGQHVGATGHRINEIFSSNVGRVLLIDEAYGLANQHQYGHVAAEVLLNWMEGPKGVVVVLAGYDQQMNALWEMNPGLKTRMANRVEFHDYSTPELLTIFLSMLGALYLLTPEARRVVASIFEQTRQEPGFGNARFARNLRDKVEEICGFRIRSHFKGRSSPARFEITSEDVLEAARDLGTHFMG